MSLRIFRIVAPGTARYGRAGALLRIRIHEDSIAIDAPLRAHLERRLDYALSGFGERVQHVVVRVSDDSLATSSSSYRCDIDVTLRPRSLKVADSGAKSSVAVTNASDRLVKAVSRALERERAWLDGEFSPPAHKRPRGG
jgi:ribosome-associated translation inhibitor RaiA